MIPGSRKSILVLLFLPLLLLTFFCGCGIISRGIIYTDTIQPLCKDLRGSELEDQVSKGSSKKVEIPFTRIDLSAEWSSRAIGDLAKANGIDVINSCDSRRFSVLAGIWRQDEVIIYGRTLNSSTIEKALVPVN